GNFRLRCGLTRNVSSASCRYCQATLTPRPGWPRGTTSAWLGAPRWIRAWSRGKEPRDARRAGPRPGRAYGARDVYCYFDNDIKVKAPGDARTLARLLDLPLAPVEPPQ